ncbi:MAG: tail fiber domain-containing protein [Bacteroidia bacterium]
MKRLPTPLLFLCLCIFRQYLQAQPDRFHYQAVARDNAGEILSNTLVNLRFQIRQSTPSGTLVYQEKHTPVTNSFGLINLSIGKGNVESGDFSTIAWADDDFYLLVELNGQGVDTTLFESVPYAHVATGMQLHDLTDVGSNIPSPDEVLVWNGAEWIPGTNSDADDDPTNEIQRISLTGNTLSLSSGGGSVNLSPFASPWSASGSNLYYNSGNIGIGDNSPIATLTVGSGDKPQIHGAEGDIVFNDDNGSLRFSNSSGSNSPMIQMFTSGTNNSTRMFVTHSPAFPSWGIRYNDTSDAFTWIGDNIPVMHVQLAGQQRVGIGTESPSAKFHVSTNSATGFGQIKLTETQFDYSRITFNNDIHPNFWDIAARTDANLANASFNIYHSNAGDIFSVNARGRVGINDATPTYTLDIDGNENTRIINAYNDLPTTAGTTYNYGLRVSLSQASNTGFPRLYNVYAISTGADSYISYGLYAYASGASNSNYGVYAYAPSSSGYAGYFSGDVYATGSYLPSDARLKSEIAPLEGGLATIMQLRAKRYVYDREHFDFMNLPAGEQYGFLAQEIEQILPTLTQRAFQAYDEALSDTYEGKGFEFTAVNYTGLIPILVTAVQEQQIIIDDQKTKIQLLEDRLEKLEAMIKK